MEAPQIYIDSRVWPLKHLLSPQGEQLIVAKIKPTLG